MSLQEEFEKQGVWLFRYRSKLPLIILGIGIFVYLHAKIYPESSFIIQTPYESSFEIFALVVSLFGLVLRIFTVDYTPKNTSGRNVKHQIADRLNTTGAYSLVRHPLYVGNFFMWLGPAILSGNIWFIMSFCFFYWIYYERIMFAEEQFLKRKFGSEYTEWSSRVPAFLPSFKQYERPDMPFSWRKILKKEKNGLVAIFIIFSLFHFSGKFIANDDNYNYFLFIACLVSLVLYLVLRYLKNRTDVLSEAGR